MKSKAASEEERRNQRTGLYGLEMISRLAVSFYILWETLSYFDTRSQGLARMRHVDPWPDIAEPISTIIVLPLLGSTTYPFYEVHISRVVLAVFTTPS
jgi:hypothetical protein